MTEPAAAPVATNQYRRWLPIIGVAALVLGAFTAFISASNAQSARNGEELLSALGGARYVDLGSDAVPTAWMWFGIVLAIVGAILLMAYLVIRAAGSGTDTPQTIRPLTRGPGPARVSLITGSVLILVGVALSCGAPIAGIPIALTGIASVVLGIVRRRYQKS